MGRQVFDWITLVLLMWFTLEMVMKLIAFGVRSYFTDNWLTFDAIIVVSGPRATQALPPPSSPATRCPSRGPPYETESGVGCGRMLNEARPPFRSRPALRPHGQDLGH